MVFGNPFEHRFRANLIAGMWRHCQSLGLLLPREDWELQPPPLYKQLDYAQFVQDLLSLCDRLPMPEDVDDSVLADRIARSLQSCASPHLQQLPTDAIAAVVRSAFRLSLTEKHQP